MVGSETWVCGSRASELRVQPLIPFWLNDAANFFASGREEGMSPVPLTSVRMLLLGTYSHAE